MSWRDHEYEIELGIELPETPVSTGEDWIDDCEEDDVFDLKPEYFMSKNQYLAALQLCQVCSGWFYFENDEAKYNRIELLRKIVVSTADSPLKYFDLQYGSFDWCRALRENNPKYRDSLYGVNGLWELFNMLGERSLLEKADCFDWLVRFFGENLKYDSRNSLTNSFVSGYGSDLEVMLYIKPELADELTVGAARVTDDELASLSKAAAGLIRYGKEAEGLNLYKTVFEEAKRQKVSSEIRKSIVDEFIERLSKGFNDEPYINNDIANTVKNHIQQFSDNEWINKNMIVLRRNTK